ncbi:MAG: hypothetical protein LBG71_03290 [Clostridiales Family XIII bacterium]|nr:hypothetical protein [Clostridiales Family XIII bacterium]
MTNILKRIGALLIAACIFGACDGAGAGNVEHKPVGGAAPANIAAPSQVVLLPKSYREKDEWRDVNEMCGYLGKSVEYIMNNRKTEDGSLCSYDYVKKDGAERLFFYPDVPNYSMLALLAPLAEEEEPRSQAVLARKYNNGSLARNAEEGKEIYGREAERRDSDGIGGGYYLYAFDDGVEARFYVASDESGRWVGIAVCHAGVDDTALEKFASGFGDGYGAWKEAISDDVILDAKESEKPEWEGARRFMSYIGRSFDEIKAEFPTLEPYYIDDPNAQMCEHGLKDEKTGLSFGAPLNKDACTYCAVPYDALLDGLIREDGTVAREDLLTYWPASHGWSNADGSCDTSHYSFRFDGIEIYVPADNTDGILPEGTEISIFG